MTEIPKNRMAIDEWIKDVAKGWNNGTYPDFPSSTIQQFLSSAVLNSPFLYIAITM